MHYYCHCFSPTTFHDTNLQLYSLKQAAENWNTLVEEIKKHEDINDIPHYRERHVFILNCFGLSLMQLLGQNSPYKRKKVDKAKPLFHAVLKDCHVEEDVRKRLGKTFDNFIMFYNVIRHFGESIDNQHYEIVDKLTLQELDEFRILTVKIWDIIIAKYKKDDRNELNEIRSVTDLVDFDYMPSINETKNAESTS